MDNSVKEEFHVIHLIGPIVMVIGDNVPYFLPLVRTKYGTTSKINFYYNQMVFFKKLFGPFYYMKATGMMRVLKELRDPTHPESEYPAAKALRAKRDELRIEATKEFPHLGESEIESIVRSKILMLQNKGEI